MSIPDIVIIIILLVFTLAGWKRGVIWELFTAVGLILAGALVWYFRIEILDLITHVTQEGWQRQWGGALIFLLIFLIVYLGCAAVGKWIHERFKNPVLKTLDSVLGLAAGFLKGAVLIALFVMAVEWMEGGGRVKMFIHDSKLIYWGKSAVHNLIRWESPTRRQWVMNPNEQLSANSREIC